MSRDTYRRPTSTETDVGLSKKRCTMELLPEGKRNTATEVSWEDQEKINKFSSLISSRDEHSAVLKKIQEEKEYLDDLALELELLDEDDEVQYKVGEAFIFMKSEIAIERINKDNTNLESKIEKEESSIEEIDEKLAKLKSELYAKFGTNINLER